MINIITRLVDLNARELRHLDKVLVEINSHEAKTKKLKDKDFAIKTEEFKKRISKGEKMESILPEAYAVVREAAARELGMRAFDVQLMAAIALFEGKVVEQKTGEGKTLTAIFALYLRALSGLGAHLVTVNDYLARRDAGWNAPAFQLLGLTVGAIAQERKSYIYDPEFRDDSHGDERLAHLKPCERKESYAADITYGTNNEFGFDYLRDNMVSTLEQMVQRGHYYAIVDEVDSVLIDEARTPLIISAPDTEPTDKYYKAASLIGGLNPDTDYTIDEKSKSANLTEHGISKVEKALGVDNLYEKDFDTIHHIENALRARSLYIKDREYVVKDDEVVIVDEFTGRLMPGRRWSDGLHQAVEAKENVKIQQESKTLATISFQNYFRMYTTLAGMTGTASTEADEFKKIYDLETVVIPTNVPVARKDHGDLIYKTVRGKYGAVAKDVEECHKKGQPVLVGTTSIEKNEVIAALLKRRKIPHNVLNAKNHEHEASIIADAGKPGGVTVATNMAGRGVDIVLGGAPPDRDPDMEFEKYKNSKAYQKWKEQHEKVLKAGGLHVIGTERHESRRIDNQLRGRSGRQGDPGSTRFYLSLEDDLMRIFGGEQIGNIMDRLKIPEDQPIENKLVSRAIEQAQVKVEGFNFDARKNVVEYDDVANQQREVIYGKRRKILESKDLSEEVLAKLDEHIEEIVEVSYGVDADQPEYERIVIDLLEIIPFDERSRDLLKSRIEKFKDKEKIKEELKKVLRDTLKKREDQVGPDMMRRIEKYSYLGAIDHLWIDHIDNIDSLRNNVRLRAYGNKDPLVEFKGEAYNMFDQLLTKIDDELSRRVFRMQIMAAPRTEIPTENVQTNVDKSDMTGLTQSTPANTPAKQGKKDKLGRNDPCWCGSGKKWKKCHINREPQTSEERAAFNLYNSDYNQWVKQYGDKKN